MHTFFIYNMQDFQTTFKATLENLTHCIRNIMQQLEINNTECLVI